MTLKTKQIAKLKSIAVNLRPITQIGKDGLTEAVIRDVLTYLEAHEIMKVTVLNNCFDDIENMKQIFIDKDIFFVQKIGKQIVLYKPNLKLKERIEL